MARWSLAVGLLAGAGLARAPRAPMPPTAARSLACAADAVRRSACMIRIILTDLETTNGGLSNGGISQIKAGSSDSYVVTLPREEAAARITYRFAFARGRVTLVDRVEGTDRPPAGHLPASAPRR